MRAKWLVGELQKCKLFDQMVFKYDIVRDVPLVKVLPIDFLDSMAIGKQLTTILLEIYGRNEYYLIVDLSDWNIIVGSPILGALCSIYKRFKITGEGALAVIVKDRFKISLSGLLKMVAGKIPGDPPPVFVDRDEAAIFIKKECICEIKVEGDFSPRTFEQVVLSQYSNKKPQLLLDMTNVVYMHPFTTVCLLSLINSDQCKGKQITVRMPQQDNVKDFLSATNFVSYLPIQIILENWERKTGETVQMTNIFGIKKYTSEDPLTIGKQSELVNEIYKRIQPCCTLRSGSQITMGHLGFFAAELCDNLIRHSSNSGFVLIQRRGDKQEVHIAISDFGIGLQESFHREWGRSDITSDRKAVEEALISREKVLKGSSQSEEMNEKLGRFGLGTIKDTVYYEKGQLVLWSGQARCVIKDRMDILDQTQGVREFQGTHCHIMIPVLAEVVEDAGCPTTA